MKSKYIRVGLVLCIMLPACNIVTAKLLMPQYFANHMVLQRNAPIQIWGWSDPGDRIDVYFAGQSKKVISDGNWQVTFPALPSGGPFTIEVSDGQKTLQLNDVVMGDIWVASGQSNMQWTNAQTGYVENDTTIFASQQLRYYNVRIGTDIQPRDDVQGGQWQIADPTNIQHFSATGYHFGRFLQQALEVPIGIIHSSLGATSIETWMSHTALQSFSQFIPDIKPIDSLGLDCAGLEHLFESKGRPQLVSQGYEQGIGMQEQWYDPKTDITDWTSVDVPVYWEDHGLPDHDGAMWFRKEFDRPEFSGDSLLIGLSQIDDYDITWLNGHMIGETYGRHNHRNYMVPASMLKDKGNVLVVRVFDIGGKGGFTTNPFWMSPLIRGSWYMQAGASINSQTFTAPITVNISPFSSPGVLFNANIAPLTRLPIRGIIWYQGESNVARAYEYRSLFPALINDWRQQWNKQDLPFLFVQLANYGQEPDQPGASNWAELREAQKLALNLPLTGMAVTIDIGEAEDIHPKNKAEVGRRLALQALKQAYALDTVCDGPTFERLELAGSSAIIHFSDADSLISTDKYGYIRGFAIAGADRRFHWAKASLHGRTVVVTSENVSDPVAVRYGWSNNPGPLDLYNEAGLPASPFRTDDWPVSTEDMHYDPLKSRF